MMLDTSRLQPMRYKTVCKEQLIKVNKYKGV